VVSEDKEDEMPIERLPVKLTEPEVAIRADELAEKVKELQDAKDGAKETQAAAKERISEIESEVKKLAGVVREKAEDRQVTCREVRNEERRTIDLVREDTGETVRYRAMTMSELTRPLFPVEDLLPGTVVLRDERDEAEGA
jgi:hypothetical protein